MGMSNNTESVLPIDPVDVAVVGGGLAGLTAAATAARGAARTVLVEASGLGGRARTDDRDGVALNLGPHALYIEGAGKRVLAELGVQGAGGVAVASGPAFAAGREGTVPTTAWSTLTTKVLTPRSRLALAAFVARAPKIDTTALDSVPIDEYLASVTDREDLLSLLHALVRLATYANAPAMLSAGAAIEQLVLGLGGVLYLDRGWETLVDGLARAARAAGVGIATGTTVRSIDVEGGGYSLDTSGGVIHASAVILAGLNPEAAARLAGVEAGELREPAGPAARAACLDLVLDDDPPHTFSLDCDRSMYYSVHSGVADLAPAGRTLASLAYYRPAGQAAGEPGADRALLTDFAGRLGIDRSADARYLHDMVVVNGFPLARRGGAAGRPGVHELAERFDRRGIYLAGDWVGPTGMLADTAISSGAAAAKAAVRLVERATA